MPFPARIRIVRKAIDKKDRHTVGMDFDGKPEPIAKQESAPAPERHSYSPEEMAAYQKLGQAGALSVHHKLGNLAKRADVVKSHYDSPYLRQGVKHEREREDAHDIHRKVNKSLSDLIDANHNGTITPATVSMHEYQHRELDGRLKSHERRIAKYKALLGVE